ncbi:MAG: hypothetical protein Q7U11_16560, partial [Phenylobacterium sp.]|nr:hypothetical protein [Phenylobacterium sp.]
GGGEGDGGGERAAQGLSKHEHPDEVSQGPERPRVAIRNNVTAPWLGTFTINDLVVAGMESYL